MLKTEKELDHITKYTNYTDYRNGTKYSPLFDPAGPYFFFPPQCFSRDPTVFNSTVIAYILNGNDYEKDLVAQLEALFKNQA